MRNSSQESSREMLKALAREARLVHTPAEAQLWEMLRDHRCGGLHFRRQKVINPFRLDFFCRQIHLAIEVDGSIHEEEDVQWRDADRQQILEQEAGIRFLRVTNEDVLQHPQQTRERILQVAREELANELINEFSSPRSRLRRSRVQMLRGRRPRRGWGIFAP